MVMDMKDLPETVEVAESRQPKVTRDDLVKARTAVIEARRAVGPTRRGEEDEAIAFAEVDRKLAKLAWRRLWWRYRVATADTDGIGEG